MKFLHQSIPALRQFQITEHSKETSLLFFIKLEVIYFCNCCKKMKFFSDYYLIRDCMIKILNVDRISIFLFSSGLSSSSLVKKNVIGIQDCS